MDVSQPLKPAEMGGDPDLDMKARDLAKVLLQRGYHHSAKSVLKDVYGSKRTANKKITGQEGSGGSGYSSEPS